MDFSNNNNNNNNNGRRNNYNKKPFYKNNRNNNYHQQRQNNNNLQNSNSIRHQAKQDNSYYKLIGRCSFYEINKNTYFSLLINRVVQKFLSQDQKTNQEINEILIRAQGKENVKKIKRIYFILTERLQGVSTIYHKCFSNMIYPDDRQKSQNFQLKRCIEVVFIKNPSEKQRNMKGFRQPKKDGEIMSFDEYKKLYNYKKELEKEIEQEQEDDLQIAEAIYAQSFFKNDQLQNDTNQDQDKEEQKQDSQKQINSDGEEEENQDNINDKESDDNNDEEESIDEDLDDLKQENNCQNLSEDILYKKVEEKVQSFNPHLKNIDKEYLNLSWNYTLTQKVVNLKPQVVKQMEQESDQFMKNVEQKISNIQKNNQELSQLNTQDQKDIVKASLFQHYRQQGCQVQITNKVNNDQSKTNSYQSQLVLTGQSEKLKYVQVRIEDKFYTYEKVLSDPAIKKEVISKFIKATAIQYGVSEDRVTILDIKKGSIIVNTSIAGLQDDLIFKAGVNQYQKEFPKAQISSTVKSLIDNYQISDDYFDERFNMQWKPYHDNMVDYRGSLPRGGQGLVPQRYHFPVGFQGYGLNVQKWLQKDKSWFGQDSDPNVWIVLYHATDGNGLKGISNSYIMPGNRNLYEGQRCRLTNEFISIGSYANSYFSDLASGPNSSEGYGGKICLGNKEYKLMFQCRVNPKHVRSPVTRVNYYTVDKKYAQESVRPYRILLKEA
ncbi:hypothetical protein ABPG74_004718 [Tetrahymena malaccensis]